jgi:hypothetical protein
LGVALDAHDEASTMKAFADAGPVDVVYYRPSTVWTPAWCRGWRPRCCRFPAGWRRI